MHISGSDGKFTSSIGFVLAAVGSAVGMANIWLFPYRVGQYGGGAFLIPYFLFVALFSYVGLSGEFALGRLTGTGAMGSLDYVLRQRGRRGGRVLGAIPLLGVLGIAIGYSVVVGWVLRYAAGSLTGSVLAGDAQGFFSALAVDFGSIPWHFAAVAVTAAILIFGVASGIEKLSKVMMPAFFILFLIIAVRVAFLPGAMEGYLYLLRPDWSYLLNPETWVMAMGQAFFSLSINGAGMLIYGSYMKKGENILRHAGMTAVLDTLASRVADVVADAEADVVGIGVGPAGLVDVRTGGIAFANELMPGWTGQPVAERLSASLGLPVAVLNDVKAHALGEARWGAARGAQTCFVIAAGTGLGGGIVANGRVLLGAHGFAGELGRTPCPDALGTPRACGTASELESIAAGSAIEARYVAAGGERPAGDEIARRAADGEELARRIILEAGAVLGEAIATWTDLLDPELVVLSGSVCNAGKAWRAALQEGFERQAPSVMHGLPIVDAALGSRAPPIGAAEYLLDTLKGRP